MELTSIQPPRLMTAERQTHLLDAMRAKFDQHRSRVSIRKFAEVHQLDGPTARWFYIQVFQERYGDG